MKPIRIRLEIVFLLMLGQYFLPNQESRSLAIAPLVAAGIAAGGAKLLGGLFGKSKPELTAEQKYASEQYKKLIAGGGYLPGERELQQQQLSRNIGAQSSLQKSLAAERLAATPGASDTAFGDAALSQYDLGAQQSLADAFANMDIQAKQRVLAAIGGVGGMQPGQMSKGNIFDVLGDIGGAAAQPIGYALGQKYSSIDAKRDIKDLDPAKIKQLLESVKNIDLKKFRYKPGIEDGGESENIGMMAEEAPPEVVTPDGKGVDMMNLISMLIASVQSLSKEFDLYKRFASRKKEIESIGS